MHNEAFRTQPQLAWSFLSRQVCSFTYPTQAGIFPLPCSLTLPKAGIFPPPTLTNPTHSCCSRSINPPPSLTHPTPGRYISPLRRSLTTPLAGIFSLFVAHSPNPWQAYIPPPSLSHSPSLWQVYIPLPRSPTTPLAGIFPPPSLIHPTPDRSITSPSLSRSLAPPIAAALRLFPYPKFLKASNANGWASSVAHA